MSANFRRLKKYISLTKEESPVPRLEASCCKAEFTEEEIEAITNCIRMELDEEEEAALYFICGYVSHQEGLPSDEILAPEALAPSQFTTFCYLLVN